MQLVAMHNRHMIQQDLHMTVVGGGGEAVYRWGFSIHVINNQG